MSEFGGLSKHENTAQMKYRKLGSAVVWLHAFHGESSLKFLYIAFGQESYLI